VPTPKDYYETLGVPRTASEEEVKRAYRRLARQHHPDLHPDKDKDLHTRTMQEVNEAYAVLGSKENRAKYDRLGTDWEKGGPPPQDREDSGAGASGEEAFSDFFRHMFREASERRSAREEFPSELDIEAALDLTLEEAVAGVEKSFSLMAAGLCRACHGTGREGASFCPRCSGVGEIRRQRQVKTKIPPGLLAGSRIRLKGQGNDGAHNRGDLYLTVRLLHHPHFNVDGKDLETVVRVMPWQAALGSTVPVQTLEGPLRLRVPKGTHAGTRLRLAGKGLGNAAERGDLFARIGIDIPDHLSPKAEALFKQLEEESHG
jgi:curved DNA-binding protein